MSADPRREISLEDVAEFHHQLLRLDAAGLSLQLDDGAIGERDLSQRLNEIMAELATQSSRARSLSEVLTNSSTLPARYRLALESWVVGERSTEALAMLRQPVQAEYEGVADLKLALVLPLLLMAVIYCASFYLLWVILPRMEAIYLQFTATEPSIPLRVLIAVRDAMPIWVPGLPLLILVLSVLISTGRLSLPRWLPGRARPVHYLNAALVARNLATQIEQGDNSEAVELVGGDDRSRSSTARVLQSPMLRWALSPAIATQAVDHSNANASEKSKRLRLAARLYETMQVLDVQRFRAALMLLACVVLGGGLTLMYALALFTPLIQLLKEIT